MEGIEILSQTAIMENPPWFGVLISLSVVCMVVSFALLLLTLITDCSGILSCIFGALAVLCFIELMILGTNHFFEKPTGRYEYKVLISEDASFTELYQKYEVTGQDEEIWILEDKE